MQTKIFIFKSVVIAILVAIVGLVFLGYPEQQNLSQKIDSYISELYVTVNSDAEAKSSFLKNGFCSNGELEQLAIQAQDPAEIGLVENLSRDCVVITELLQS